MNFPKLAFPITVDFCSVGYWVENQGPFKYGAAVTAFFIDGDITEAANEGISLLRDLERQLQTFGSHLKPYMKEREMDAMLFLQPENRRWLVPCALLFILLRTALESWRSGMCFPLCVIFSMWN